MQTYQYFLAAGIGLSVISKALQFKLGKPELGNLIVLPAAACFTLTLLFLYPPFVRAAQMPGSQRGAATGLAVAACAAVALVQLALMALVGKSWLRGTLLLGVLLPVLYTAYRFWLVIARG